MATHIFYSIPTSCVDRTVCFEIDYTQPILESWNNDIHGHVFEMKRMHEDDIVIIMNSSDEAMLLYGFDILTSTSYYISMWTPGELQIIPINQLLYGTLCPFYVVLNDIPVFNVKAYLYRKVKPGIQQKYYTREENIYIPRGIYTSIGEIAATLNQNIGMRGERNGYVYHFIARKGKLAIEAAHKQPEPSFMEVNVLCSSMGMTENSVLRLRTRERLSFDNDVKILV